MNHLRDDQYKRQKYDSRTPLPPPSEFEEDAEFLPLKFFRDVLREEGGKCTEVAAVLFDDEGMHATMPGGTKVIEADMYNVYQKKRTGKVAYEGIRSRMSSWKSTHDQEHLVEGRPGNARAGWFCTGGSNVGIISSAEHAARAAARDPSPVRVSPETIGSLTFCLSELGKDRRFSVPSTVELFRNGSHPA